MKKKFLASLLTAAMVMTSFAPVYGAEFISEPGEVEAAFSDGEEPVVEEADAPAAEAAADGTTMELTQPNRTHFGYGIQAKVANDLSLEGTRIAIKKDGEVIDGDIFEYNEHYSVDYNYSWSLYEGSEELDWDDEVHAGGVYRAVVTAENYDATAEVALYVDAPESVIPEVQKNGETTYASTQPYYGDVMKAYARFTPSHTGLYEIKAKCNREISDASFRICDQNSDEIWQETENRYRLQQGQIYYFIFEGNSWGPGMTVDFTVNEFPHITKLEWEKKPVKPLYSGVSMQSYGVGSEGVTKINGNIKDAVVKVTYSDGSTELIDTGDTLSTKYGDYLQNDVKCGETSSPKPGTYKVEFYIYGNEALNLTADIVIKDGKELPTIKGTGSVKVPFDSCVRFETSSKTIYKANCDRENSVFISFREAGTERFTDTENDQPFRLKPNTVYYVSSFGPDLGVKDTITYKISTGKLPMSYTYINEISAKTYTGKAIKPSVEIVGGPDVVLKKDKDYTVSYSNNTKIGTATVTVKGKGEYTGTIKSTFKIVPGKVSITSYKRTGSTSAKISWKSVKGAQSYAIYRATGSKWTKIATTKSTTYTDKKIKKGTSYKYRVRAYAKAGSKTIYGSYSSTKTVK